MSEQHWSSLKGMELRMPNRFILPRFVWPEDKPRSIRQIRRDRLVEKLLRYHRRKRTAIRILLHIVASIVIVAVVLGGAVMLSLWLHSLGARRVHHIGVPIGLGACLVLLVVNDLISYRFDNTYLKVKRKGRIYE